MPIGEDCFSVKDIQVAVLPSENLQTGSFVGESRVVRLPRLETHPNEALRVAVCLSKKKGRNGISAG